MAQHTHMPLRRLGTSGLSVGAVGMGVMPLSIGGRPDEAAALATIHAAAEAGITFYDTADSYCLDHTDIGHNERLLAKALKDHPEALIATKGGHIRPDGSWKVDGRPDYLRAACEASLKALGQEAITLYQFHRPDPQVPFAESLGALADLQREGKIVHIGLSNVSVIQLEAARSIAKIVSVQNRMNIFDRSSIDVLKRCEELDIAFLPYSPLNGRGRAGQIGEHEAISRIAAAHEASPQQVALAWLLQLSPLVIPIPGASRSASIQNSAAAYRVQLSAEEVATLDAFATV